MKPEEISNKLKAFAHSEFSEDQFSDPNIIKKKISQKIDLFDRNHNYEEIKLNENFPKYILENKEKYQNFLIEVE